MKTSVIAFGVLLYSSWPASANTNNSINCQAMFSAPAVQLRSSDPGAQASAIHDAISEDPASSVRNASAELHLPGMAKREAIASAILESSFGAQLSQREMRIYRRLDEAGYLTRPERETGLPHFLDRTFTPEKIQLGKGKTFAQCTLYTAIKRMNPLSLLNPLFFSIEW